MRSVYQNTEASNSDRRKGPDADAATAASESAMLAYFDLSSEQDDLDGGEATRSPFFSAFA